MSLWRVLDVSRHEELGPQRAPAAARAGPRPCPVAGGSIIAVIRGDRVGPVAQLGTQPDQAGPVPQRGPRSYWRLQRHRADRW
jgi:hypothetical protein